MKMLLIAMASLLPLSAASVYDYSVKTIDGTPAALSSYKGKTVLIVNVASKCGYTPQYAGLQKLYAKYKDRGFVILGFPANNFGAQEPGTNAEIKTFCSRTYNVTFPMFSKISVKGDDKAPLYQYLTETSPNAATHGDIQWNFTKFLIGKDGKVVARFEPDVTPESAEMEKAIEGALR
jgi:glutathione peroxidase